MYMVCVCCSVCCIYIYVVVFFVLKKHPNAAHVNQIVCCTILCALGDSELHKVVWDDEFLIMPDCRCRDCRMLCSRIRSRYCSLVCTIVDI